MGDEPEELASRITTREDMATFLEALSGDAVERGSQWENLHIFDVLESMAAWLRDTSGHDAFAYPELTSEQWQFVADLILAGKHYE